MTPRQRRHFMIEMAKRRVQPGSGSALEFLHRRTALEKWPDLREILDGIPWVVVGSVATRAYMPERKTMDMDILVHTKDGQEVVARLRDAGYKIVSPLVVPGFLTRSPKGIELDVIFGDAKWVRQALAHPNQDKAGYPTIALPYLVLMKLMANRGRDVGDMSSMLGLATEQERDAVRRVIAKYSPEDLDDLESLVFLGKKELESPHNKTMKQKAKK